jgi:hypothetical protein
MRDRIRKNGGISNLYWYASDKILLRVLNVTDVPLIRIRNEIIGELDPKLKKRNPWTIMPIR